MKSSKQTKQGSIKETKRTKGKSSRPLENFDLKIKHTQHTNIPNDKEY